jgi:uncharacterized YccA/Bax inhibitor family protein
MKSGNPVLSDKILSQPSMRYGAAETMTVQGAVNRTAILLVIAMASAFYTWSKFFQTQNPQSVTGWMTIGIIAGLILAVITIFKMNWSPITAPLYAAAQGLALGGISAVFEAQYPGIAFQAIMATFGVLAAMLVVYTSGLIKVTDKFRMGVASATLGIAAIYFLTIILQLFGVNVPYIYGNGLIGIGFSVVVIIIASMNLVLDFDMINNVAVNGAPKYMEWYCAFSLMVTLIWLYLEILRLLSKIRGRD